MTNTNNTKHQTSILTLGLAIFAMLFGAGNIIWPIKGGVLDGSKNLIGIIGFITTAVMLPVIGLVAMILFDGDYNKFFNRIGKIPAFLAITFCMLIIGPFIAMPRCITVPYDMVSHFLPSWLSLSLFTIIFTITTFVLTYKETKLLDLLGKVLSPIKIATIALIVIKGVFWGTHQPLEQKASSLSIFWGQAIQGFQTLDLLGTIFFAYIIVKILKSTNKDMSQKDLLNLSLKGGFIGAGLLTIVYLGMSYLGAFYGYLVDPSMNGAQMFSVISLHVLQNASIIIVIAVCIACLATLTTLAVVFTEYLRNEIFRKKVGYIPCLIITLTITTIISNFGLSNILYYSLPIINFGYPIIIAITFCNLAYALFGFKPIKIPVVLTTLGMIFINFR